MIAVRYAVSDVSKTDLRMQLLEDHKHFLRNAPINILLSGPLSSDGNVSNAAAIIIADVESLDALSRFSDDDPFVRAGVYSAVSIMKWLPTTGSLLPDVSKFLDQR